MTEHAVLQDPYIHEPKGASSASLGSAYISDGAGSGSWIDLAGIVVQGIYDYNDVTTQSTPIALTVVDTDYELTNDGAGVNSYKNALTGLPDVWNVSTDRFIWTGGSVLAIGDTVDLRLDVEVTTSTVNSSVTIELEMDVDGTPYRIPLIPGQNFKVSGVFNQIRWMGVYMGSSATLNGGGRIIARSDTAGVSIKVNGWYLRALHGAGV